MKQKRSILFAAVLLVTCGGLGCQSSGREATARGIVAIGTTKVDLLGIPPEYRALHPALERELGRPVMFNSQPNGAAIGRQLEQGNIPFAILTAGEYAAVADRSKLN